jgi:hypothetical protein
MLTKLDIVFLLSFFTQFLQTFAGLVYKTMCSIFFQKKKLFNVSLTALIDTGEYYLQIAGQQVSSMFNLLGTFQLRKFLCLKQCHSTMNCYLVVFASTPNKPAGLCQLFDYLALNNLVNATGFDVYRKIS